MINTSVPFNYAVCIKSDCPKSKSCLRSIAWRLIQNKDQFIKVVNPLLATSSESCSFYRENIPVAFAKGFINMKNEMLTWQYSEFMNKMIKHFGRNPYFVRRRGEILLSKSEQEVILNIIKDIGISKSLKFDEYIEGFDW